MSKNVSGDLKFLYIVIFICVSAFIFSIFAEKNLEDISGKIGVEKTEYISEMNLSIIKGEILSNIINADTGKQVKTISNVSGISYVIGINSSNVYVYVNSFDKDYLNNIYKYLSKEQSYNIIDYSISKNEETLDPIEIVVHYDRDYFILRS